MARLATGVALPFFDNFGDSSVVARTAAFEQTGFTEVCSC
jgi:hypothetical protein